MKNIAPFLGVQTPERRSLVRRISRSLPPPSEADLARVSRKLWSLPFREYHYAAFDLLQIHKEVLGRSFLADHCEYLLSHKSWWDTVDGLGSAVVSPLTVTYPSVGLMRGWLVSENIWLNRAAIQHQRGRKTATNIPLLLEFCDYHSDSHEFFIAKAIGWALRDLSRIDNRAVTHFLKEHPELDRVAVREAVKLHKTK
jgi:3-methyladenine DNA glycosylase AlkD